MQLQDRHQPFERLLRRVLRFGERRGNRRTPRAQPILQRVVQLLLRERRVVPVAAEDERFAKAPLVEWLEQVVHDLVAQAGDRDLDVAHGRCHDDGGVGKAIADLRREPHAIAPGAAEPDVADGNVARLVVERRQRASRCGRLPRTIAEAVHPRADLRAECRLVIDDEHRRSVR